MRFKIIYSPEAGAHLRALTARRQAIVLDGVDRHLFHEPAVQTRNRKLLRPNPIATWELRLGELRVYYEMTGEPALTVNIRAIGVKDRQRVRIAGVEFDL